MTEYTYPKVTSGYRWNLLKRCLWEVGIEPTCIGDRDIITYLQFDRDLTTTEKTTLDTIMSGDPQNPPTTGIRLSIKDLWGGTNGGEDFEAFKVACNLPNLRMFYIESTPGSGVVDRICLWHPTALTNTQKNAIKTQFANLYIG
jgi:hypothetical protein